MKFPMGKSTHKKVRKMLLEYNKIEGEKDSFPIFLRKKGIGIRVKKFSDFSGYWKSDFSGFWKSDFSKLLEERRINEVSKQINEDVKILGSNLIKLCKNINGSEFVDYEDSSVFYTDDEDKTAFSLAMQGGICVVVAKGSDGKKEYMDIEDIWAEIMKPLSNEINTFLQKYLEILISEELEYSDAAKKIQKILDKF